VDVSVDQGGCVETTRPTSHSDPVYVVDGVLHYAVPNIPGVVPHTSTFALTNASLPFILRLAESGPEQAVRTDPVLAKGLNLAYGRVTCRAVAEAHGGSVQVGDSPLGGARVAIVLPPARIATTQDA